MFHKSYLTRLFNNIIQAYIFSVWTMMGYLFVINLHDQNSLPALSAHFLIFSFAAFILMIPFAALLITTTDYSSRFIKAKIASVILKIASYHIPVIIVVYLLSTDKIFAANLLFEIPVLVLLIVEYGSKRIKNSSILLFTSLAVGLTHILLVIIGILVIGVSVVE
ncbi:hypothetical protein ACQCT6_05185 [Cytobacillus gottheilii]|uniref:Yip1 domain-containing protein n=1 Tax=Cytobacillus gottheilii TaxID=859144 RepID=A0ABX8FG91_9BACI|nr:hypothetical protein [Cytobacillus gottheilii]QVY63013.1 hypothetical protein J1899_08220 [Cytobacillus gottheilii]